MDTQRSAGDYLPRVAVKLLQLEQEVAEYRELYEQEFQSLERKLKEIREEFAAMAEAEQASE